jgi:flagellar biosynthesis/type III secretory pathway M-ring protein FliF/YscJ
MSDQSMTGILVAVAVMVIVALSVFSTPPPRRRKW